MAGDYAAVLYSATVKASSGRDGAIVSDDGVLDIPLTMPRGLGGSGEVGTNPEQLFAACYSACFASAVKMCASEKKIPIKSVEITGIVHIGRTEKGFGLSIELIGKMPGLSREQAEGLMHAAHQVCPYSNATRGNVEVRLTVA